MSESRRIVMSGIVLAGIVSVVLLNIAPMPHGSVSLPEYNSGWISINQGESITLTHNLGTTEVSIEMWGNDSYGNIHQRNYGGNQPKHQDYCNLGFINPPAWDSEWREISKGADLPLTHNVGTTNVLVYVIGNYSPTESPLIHQIDYGGDMKNTGDVCGVWWEDLTATTITVHRRSDDDKWKWVRVMIWKIPPKELRYTAEIGAYWDNLTSSTIDVYRAQNDTDWEQVCVKIWKIQPPAVGGLWIPVDKLSLLTPYIALVSTIILAISMSVAYIKIRKKQ